MVPKSFETSLLYAEVLYLSTFTDNHIQSNCWNASLKPYFEARQALSGIIAESLSGVKTRIFELDLPVWKEGDIRKS